MEEILRESLARPWRPRSWRACTHKDQCLWSEIERRRRHLAWDPPTFERIIFQHIPLIRQWLSGLGVRSRDVDDMEQEVLCAALRKFATFAPFGAESSDMAARSWVHSICQRQAANYHRKNRQRAEDLRDNDELEDLGSASPDPEQCFLEGERALRLLRGMHGLPPERRAVIVAYAMEETAMEVVADKLGISVNTAWNRLRLAREDLRATFHREETRHGPHKREDPQRRPAPHN